MNKITLSEVRDIAREVELELECARHVSERAEERAAFQLLRSQRCELERENAALRDYVAELEDACDSITLQKAQHACAAINAARKETP